MCNEGQQLEAAIAALEAQSAFFGDAVERERWVCVADSTNDQPMFARFPLSVGVANLADLPIG